MRNYPAESTLLFPKRICLRQNFTSPRRVRSFFFCPSKPKIGRCVLFLSAPRCNRLPGYLFSVPYGRHPAHDRRMRWAGSSPSVSPIGWYSDCSSHGSDNAVGGIQQIAHDPCRSSAHCPMAEIPHVASPRPLVLTEWRIYLLTQRHICHSLLIIERETKANLR